MHNDIVKAYSSFINICTRDYGLTLNALATTFIPVILILINLFFIRSPLLGVPATIAFLLIGGQSINWGNLFSESDKIIGISIRIFAIVVVFTIIGSFFVMFYNFNTDVYVVLLLSIASLIAFARMYTCQIADLKKYLSGVKLYNKFNLKVPSHRNSIIVVSIFTILMIMDISMLVDKRDTPSSLIQKWDGAHAAPILSIWQLIPAEHMYIFYFFAVLLLVSITKLNPTLMKVLILVFSVNMELVAAYVIPTVYVESDPWYMMAEVNQNIHDVSRITLSDILLGNYSGIQTSHIGPFEIPTALVTGWARGIPNAIAVFFIYSTSVDTVQIWPFLAPIMMGFFLRILTYAVSEKLTGNQTIALFSMLAISMSSTFFVLGLLSIKSTISLPFVLLGLLINLWYFDKRTKGRLLANIIFTVLNVLNYSLYFIFFLQSLIATFLLRLRSRITRLDKILYFPVVTAVLALILSNFDRLLNAGTVGFKLEALNLINSLTLWSMKYVGLTIASNGDILATTPKNIFLNDPIWIFANLVYVSFLIYGAISFKKLRTPYSIFFFWIFIIIHLSIFVSVYIQTPPSSVGTRAHYVGILTEIPLIATGLWKFEKVIGKFRLGIDVSMTRGAKLEKIIGKFRVGIIPYVFCTGLIAFPIMAAISMNPGYYWPSSTDVMAVRYLVASETNTYVVATMPVVANVLHTYTDGKLIAGGFDLPRAYQSGNLYQVLVSSYITITRDPKPGNFEKVLADIGPCNLYVIVSSNDPFSSDKSGLQKLGTFMHEEKSFESNGETTYLFKYQKC